MGDGFNVNVGDVRSHSSTVATISTQVHAACNAPSASDNAYGEIGKFFAAALILASSQVRDGIMQAVKSFMDFQSGLKAVADAYHEADQAHAELMRLLKEGDK